MTQKILIGLGLVMIVGCALTVALVQRLTNTDRVNIVVRQIADFDLPQGYQTDYARLHHRRL